MGARQVLALGGAALGALAALNSALAAPPPPPRQQTPGRPARYRWSEGDVFYTVSGEGPPVVLVHGVGIAASSFEMRYIAEPLARRFQVYALDLPGFGRSERPRAAYSGDLYTALVADFIGAVAGAPARIVAAGTSAGYAAAVAARRPDLVQALVFSSPPPLDHGSDTLMLSRRSVDLLLGAPMLGQSLYNVLTGRNAIRSYLREVVYSNPNLVTESMVDAEYALAHQPNARLTIQAYLAGKLQTDMAAILPQVEQPMLLVFGDRPASPALWTSLIAGGPLPEGAAIASTYTKLNARARVLLLERCGLLPHEEQAERFVAAVDAFLGA